MAGWKERKVGYQGESSEDSKEGWKDGVMDGRNGRKDVKEVGQSSKNSKEGRMGGELGGG